jgi:hypothetical protein
LAEGTTAVSHFIKKHIQQHEDSFKLWSLMKENKSDEELVPLFTPLFGEEDKPSSILWRKEYGSIMEEIDKSLSKPGRAILLAGNRGIGKSVLGLCYVLKCARRNEVVLYQRGKTFTLVFLVELVLGVKQDFENRNYYIPSPGLYDLDQDHVALREALILNRDITFVQDIGDWPGAEVVRTGASSKWLLISSPNSEKLESPLRHGNIDIFIMSLWTEAELKLVKPQDFPESKMMERFKLFGGVPRLVFGPLKEEGLGIHTVRTSESNLQIAYAEVSMDDLVKMLRTKEYSKIPKNVAGIMINISPESNTERASCTMKIASKEIHDHLIENFLTTQRLQLSGFLNMVKDVPELGGYRGYILETHVHKTLLAGARVRMRILESRSKDNYVDVVLPRMSCIRFEAEDLTDIPAFDSNRYARPWSKIFPTLDSFAVMDAKLFFGPNATGGLCVVIYQSTVAGRHPPESDVISRIHNRMCALLGITDKKTLKLAFVFVTDPNGIRTKQSIKTTGTQNEARFSFEFQQFAMLLGSEFDEILKWENERVIPE